MSLIRPLLSSSLLAGMLAAQVNPFVFYPQDPERQTVTCTSFVGRPDGNNAAEALIEIDSQHFRGVGDTNGVVRFFGIYHWVADERLSTSETYDLVVRRGAAGGGPDMTGAGVMLHFAGLSTPPSPNPSRGTWIMYDGFGIPGGLVFGTGNGIQPTHYVGVGLSANPLWPATDGHSLFRADMVSANTGAAVGEDNRAGAPNPTWAGRTSQPSFSTPWTYILGPFVTSPNLHIGGIDPSSTRLGAVGANLSMNGLFPDVSGSPRSDGLLLRASDNLAPFGFVFFGASLGFQTPYYSWGNGPGLIGLSHIGDESGTPAITLGISLLQSGVREFQLAAPGSIPASLVGVELAFQAVVIDASMGLGQWTNAQAVHF